jgi:heme A synthase
MGLLHRYCRLLALCVLLLITAGALIGGWTTAPVYQQIHRILASVVGLLTIGLVILAWRVKAPRWVRGLSLAAVLLVLIQGALGALSVRLGLPAAVSILHACAAQSFFALTAVLATFASPSVEERLGLEDSGFPSLRGLALIAPALILAQVALGAAYRHGLLGLMPHILGALAATGFVTLVTMIVFTQYAGRVSIIRPAKRLLIITLHQVVLGVLAYVTSIISGETGGSGFLKVAVPVIHVALGALTLGASVLFAVQVRRHLVSPVVSAAL